MTFYRKTTLPNGLRVVTEAIPHVRSASVGIWVGAGSCFEEPAEMGVSHLIEHMLFKGTERRTALQIAREIDGRGGALNAFTSKEHTCYYARVLDEHLPVAIDVLADMLQNALFDPAELEKEKGVVLEEIKMYEDVPDDLVHDLFAGAIWRQHAYGRPIVGSVESVTGLTREAILAYKARRYLPENIVVAAAGHLDHDQVVEWVARSFSTNLPGWGATSAAAGGADGATSAVATAGANAGATAGTVAGEALGMAGAARSAQLASCLTAPAALTKSFSVLRSKQIEQTHLVLGTQALPQEHPEIYPLHVLNTILGGGASSRLFQEIREERGLAYSVYAYHSSFRRAGNFAVYAGVSPQQVGPVLSLINQLLADFGRQGVAPEELHEAKEQLKGQLMLGLESTSSRMTRLGRGELNLGRVYSPDQVIDKIEAVTMERVNNLAAQLLLEPPRVLAAVGTVPDEVDLTGLGFGEVQHV